MRGQATVRPDASKPGVAIGNQSQADVRCSRVPKLRRETHSDGESLSEIRRISSNRGLLERKKP